MTTLVGRVVARSLGVLGGALVAVGLATAGLLHAMEHRAVDRELLAAASSFGQRGPWQAEHLRSRLQVGWAEDQGARAEWIESALAHERPTWIDAGEYRVLLLVVERESEHERDDQHRVVLASAPKVTIARSVGPFLLAYGLAAAGVALAAGWLQRRWLLQAVRPLADAVDTVERATGAAIGTRVAVDGPEEVRALLTAVDALLARRDDAYRAQSRFSAAAAHELRTPVAVLLGELDLALRRERTNEEYVAALQTARAETRRLAALVEGLLLLARIDAGQAEQNRTREHVTALVDAALRRERPTIELGGGSVRVEDGPDPEVEVHEALVVAALANLLRNAAHHAPGAAVTIRRELRDGAVAILVSDDGPGFARAPTFERRPEAGLGLGLPITREVARRHGGDCVVEPRDRGAAVALILPVAP